MTRAVERAVEAPDIAPGPFSGARLAYWTIRRELWENRSLWIAPLAVAGVILLGTSIGAVGLARLRRVFPWIGSEEQQALIGQPCDVAAVALILTAFVVGALYCLDALGGERRDRSILFWKSLPVSDRTTVLSKASIPFAVLPSLTFGITLVTQGLMLPASGAREYHPLRQSVILAYGLIALALWHAPIYGWLLLISSSVRRAAFLWAVLPMVAIQIFEKIAFRTASFASMLNRRVAGFASNAFVFLPKRGLAIDSLAQLTPGAFLRDSAVWLGLAFAALCLALAVRQRRDRGPI